jgi:hypothetical protein
MGGIGLQQFFVCLFVLVMVKFHADVRRTGHQRITSWRRQLFSIYFALALITVSPFPYETSIPLHFLPRDQLLTALKGPHRLPPRGVLFRHRWAHP